MVEKVNPKLTMSHDHPQNYQIFLDKMVNPNLIMTIFTIPDYFVVEIVEIC
jgi:hypothetical protein